MESYTLTLLHCLRAQTEHLHRVLEKLDAHIAADHPTPDSLAPECGNRPFAHAESSGEEERHVASIPCDGR